MAAALDGLAALEAHARTVADAYRWHDPAAGRPGLARLIDTTQTLLRLAAMAACVAGTDLIATCRALGRPADEITRRAADLIIAAQEAADWPALAAALDTDFIAALDAWRDVFEAMLITTGESGPGGRAA